MSLPAKNMHAYENHERHLTDFNEFRVAPLGFNDLFASYIYSSHFIFSGFLS